MQEENSNIVCEVLLIPIYQCKDDGEQAGRTGNHSILIKLLLNSYY